jgi:hypothetical protein
MVRRKSTADAAEGAAQGADDIQPGQDLASTPASQEPAPPPAEGQPHAAVQAPEAGEGRAYTIDNRLGYRKEDSPDGKRRQIRFADREGGERPDDAMLGPVRNEKPMVSYTTKAKAWQARKTPDGFEALDRADQELADLGRTRTGGKAR